MIDNPIFQPVVVLLAWTMVMWLWMYATRLPAMGKAQVNPDDLVKGPKKSLDDVLPPQVQWKAHNYNHLHEAPTLFYAVCLLLAMTGNGGGHGTQIAWAYVGSARDPLAGAGNDQQGNAAFHPVRPVEPVPDGADLPGGAGRFLAHEQAGQFHVGRPAELANRAHFFEPVSRCAQSCRITRPA